MLNFNCSLKQAWCTFIILKMGESWHSPSERYAFRWWQFQISVFPKCFHNKLLVQMRSILHICSELFRSSLLLKKKVRNQVEPTATRAKGASKQNVPLQHRRFSFQLSENQGNLNTITYPKFFFYLYWKCMTNVENGFLHMMKRKITYNLTGW